MIQLGIEQARPPHPLRITYAGAFVEGWAIYAETLADDWGLFTGSRDLFGHLHWLIFRAARAMVDHQHPPPVLVHRPRAGLARRMAGAFPPISRRSIPMSRGSSANPGVRTAEAMAWLAIADRAPKSTDRRRAFHRSLLAGRAQTRREHAPACQRASRLKLNVRIVQHRHRAQYRLGLHLGKHRSSPSAIRAWATTCRIRKTALLRVEAYGGGLPLLSVYHISVHPGGGNVTVHSANR